MYKRVLWRVALHAMHASCGRCSCKYGQFFSCHFCEISHHLIAYPVCSKCTTTKVRSILKNAEGSRAYAARGALAPAHACAAARCVRPRRPGACHHLAKLWRCYVCNFGSRQQPATLTKTYPPVVVSHTASPAWRAQRPTGAAPALGVRADAGPDLGGLGAPPCAQTWVSGGVHANIQRPHPAPSPACAARRPRRDPGMK